MKCFLQTLMCVFETTLEGRSISYVWLQPITWERNMWEWLLTAPGGQSVHYGLSPIEKGDIKNFKFKALLHIQLWSKNVQTFFKWCQTPKSWLLILVFIIYVKYLRSYLQKTWRGGLTNLKFCVLANQLVPKKRVENNIFVRGPLHGANIGQIFSSPFSSENMFWNICSHF